MKKETWYRAKNLTESDIAVIVDTNTETIWFWEGNKSSARDRSTARDILGKLKKKYIPYTFKRVTKNSPDNILLKIDQLLEESFKGKIPGVRLESKDFSRIFYDLNIASCLLIGAVMIYLWSAFFWSSSAETLGYLHFSINYDLFLFYIAFNSYVLLVSCLIYMSSAFFGRILNKKLFSYLSLVAGVFTFITFFIMRIWDITIYFELEGNAILIRDDVFILFVMALEFLLAPALGIGIFTGIYGLTNINLLERTEENEEGEKREKTNQ
ncbi:MAG: hypothetical protein R6U96_06515 [Promethearchaeia archaeon]